MYLDRQANGEQQIDGGDDEAGNEDQLPPADPLDDDDGDDGGHHVDGPRQNHRVWNVFFVNSFFFNGRENDNAEVS